MLTQQKLLGVLQVCNKFRNLIIKSVTIFQNRIIAHFAGDLIIKTNWPHPVVVTTGFREFRACQVVHVTVDFSVEDVSFVRFLWIVVQLTYE